LIRKDGHDPNRYTISRRGKKLGATSMGGAGDAIGSGVLLAGAQAAYESDGDEAEDYDSGEEDTESLPAKRTRLDLVAAVATSTCTGGAASVDFNPAASLVASCPCGCKDNDADVEDNGAAAAASHMPESPVTSPTKGSYALVQGHTVAYSRPVAETEGPLDMSKTSPMFKASATSGDVTPPPTPPNEDREKFRCLYLLVDAAVSQLEREIASGERSRHVGRPATTACA
jgi:homeobox protein TGIF1